MSFNEKKKKFKKNEPRFSCGKCWLEFSTLAALKSHSRSHRNYSCGRCFKKLDLVDLVEHYRKCPMKHRGGQDQMLMENAITEPYGEEEDERLEEGTFSSKELNCMKQLLEMECKVVRAPMDLNEFERLLEEYERKPRHYPFNESWEKQFFRIVRDTIFLSG